jgi:hypothetical protein
MASIAKARALKISRPFSAFSILRCAETSVICRGGVGCSSVGHVKVAQVSERGAPLSVAGYQRMVARAVALAPDRFKHFWKD